MLSLFKFALIAKGLTEKAMRDVSRGPLVQRNYWKRDGAVYLLHQKTLDRKQSSIGCTSISKYIRSDYICDSASVRGDVYVASCADFITSGSKHYRLSPFKNLQDAYCTTRDAVIVIFHLCQVTEISLDIEDSFCMMKMVVLYDENGNLFLCRKKTRPVYILKDSVFLRPLK